MDLTDLTPDAVSHFKSHNLGSHTDSKLCGSRARFIPRLLKLFSGVLRVLSLADVVQTILMLRYNKRLVGIRECVGVVCWRHT